MARCNSEVRNRRTKERISEQRTKDSSELYKGREDGRKNK